MKKTLAVIIAAAMCLMTVFALASCKKDPADTGADTSAPASSEAPATQPDTTEAPATQPDTTTEAKTEAPTTTEPADTKDGESFIEDDIYLYEPRDTDHSPVSAKNGTELACKFTIPAGNKLTGLFFESCPTWTQEGSGFTVELYKWDNDYDNTVAGEPLFTEQETDWIDNAELEVDFTDVIENGFPEGTYMWIFRGDTDNIGIWALDPAEGCEYFENGVEAFNGFQVVARILVPEN